MPLLHLKAVLERIEGIRSIMEMLPPGARGEMLAELEKDGQFDDLPGDAKMWKVALLRSDDDPLVKAALEVRALQTKAALLTSRVQSLQQIREAEGRLKVLQAEGAAHA